MKKGKHHKAKDEHHKSGKDKGYEKKEEMESSDDSIKSDEEM